MSQYPPPYDDPRSPYQQRPGDQPPSWGNSGWEDAQWGGYEGQPPRQSQPLGQRQPPRQSRPLGQPQPQPDDPHAPTGGYGQYGQYGPPSQQPAPGYGQYGQQGQYGQSQPGWGYAPAPPQPQYGNYGGYGAYGPPPAQHGYPIPGQQYTDDDYLDPPRRRSRRGIYTILSVFGVILAIIVACGVLANSPHPAPANTASIAGTWYGPANVLDGAGTIATEAYMDLKQTGTSVTGTGKLCVNRRSSALEYVNIKIDGSMSGNNAAITWHTDNLTNGIKGDHELTGTLTNGTLSLIYQDGGSNVTFGAKKGTRQDYLAACRKLPQS